jgi:hypothetical protein
VASSAQGWTAIEGPVDLRDRVRGSEWILDDSSSGERLPARDMPGIERIFGGLAVSRFSGGDLRVSIP